MIHAHLILVILAAVLFGIAAFLTPTDRPRFIALGLLAFAISLLTGCVGSGEGGAWTPADTRSTLGAVNEGIGTYEHARAAYYGTPYQYQQSTYQATP